MRNKAADRRFVSNDGSSTQSCRSKSPTRCHAAYSAALSFYLALMTGTCLNLVGGAGPTIVEGPFARNPEYLAMLQAVTTRPVLTNAAVTGTSIGAAMLFGDDEFPLKLDQIDAALPLDELRNYADQWLVLADTE